MAIARATDIHKIANRCGLVIENHNYVRSPQFYSADTNISNINRYYFKVKGPTRCMWAQVWFNEYKIVYVFSDIQTRRESEIYTADLTVEKIETIFKNLMK